MLSGSAALEKGRRGISCSSTGPPSFHTRIVAPSLAAWPLRLATMPATVTRAATPRSMTKISSSFFIASFRRLRAGSPAPRGGGRAAGSGAQDEVDHETRHVDAGGLLDSLQARRAVDL